MRCAAAARPLAWSTGPVGPASPTMSRSLLGTARDPAFTTEVARGAGVVYQTLNPPYHEWTA